MLFLAVRRREITCFRSELRSFENRWTSSLFIRCDYTRKASCALRSSARELPLESTSNCPLSVPIIACLVFILILTSSHISSSPRRKTDFSSSHAFFLVRLSVENFSSSTMFIFRLSRGTRTSANDEIIYIYMLAYKYRSTLSILKPKLIVALSPSHIQFPPPKCLLMNNPHSQLSRGKLDNNETRKSKQCQRVLITFR